MHTGGSECEVLKEKADVLCHARDDPPWPQRLFSLGK